MSTRQAVYASYRTKEARKLLDVYYKAKARAMSCGGMLHKPQEWAGAMLVVHGSYAAIKLDEAKAEGIRIPKFNKVKALVTGALNAELAKEHGKVACHSCDRRSFPTMAWRCRQKEDGDSYLWACDRCAVTLDAAPS